MPRTPEQVLVELEGFLDGLVRFFAPYEYSDGVKTILSQLKTARLRALELGELLTNDPENKAMKAQLTELSGTVTGLTKQLTKLVSEIESKDEKIKQLEEELARLKKE